MDSFVKNITKEILKKEDSLSIYATKSKNACRLIKIEEDIRPAFFHDIDTIIYSTSYSRYSGKTQVYSFLDNDHITRRMTHVQLVSKISRTIGRGLNLNEDLIEAIALGHDVGHTPIGHVGEKFLDELSQRELGIPFLHNLQSVRTFLVLNKANLTIQVLDGIMCHNGEILSNEYEPKTKTKSAFLIDFKNASKDKNYAKKLRPMTLEGCVIRISDVIAYVGRDIEDAVRLKKLKFTDLPNKVIKVLGKNNSEIINTLIMDILKESYGKNKIVLSKPVYDALNTLKDFNYKNIYNKANTSEDLLFYKEGIEKLYVNFLNDLNTKNKKSIIYKEFLDGMSTDYLENTNTKKIVIDFLAGMTDEYFIKQVKSVN